MQHSTYHRSLIFLLLMMFNFKKSLNSMLTYTSKRIANTSYQLSKIYYSTMPEGMHKQATKYMKKLKLRK